MWKRKKTQQQRAAVQATDVDVQTWRLDDYAEHVEQLTQRWATEVAQPLDDGADEDAVTRYQLAQAEAAGQVQRIAQVRDALREALTHLRGTAQFQEASAERGDEPVTHPLYETQPNETGAEPTVEDRVLAEVELLHQAVTVNEDALAAARARRDQVILAAHEHGISAYKIAGRLGVAESTVGRIIAKHVDDQP